jgi:hypothetical protein
MKSGTITKVYTPKKIIACEKMKLTQFIQRTNSTTIRRKEKYWKIENEGKEGGDGPRLVM